MRCLKPQRARNSSGEGIFSNGFAAFSSGLSGHEQRGDQDDANPASASFMVTMPVKGIATITSSATASMQLGPAKRRNLIRCKEWTLTARKRDHRQVAIRRRGAQPTGAVKAPLRTTTLPRLITVRFAGLDTTASARVSAGTSTRSAAHPTVSPYLSSPMTFAPP